MAVSKSQTTILLNKYSKNSLKGVKICSVATVPFHVVCHLRSQVEYLRDTGMYVVLVSSNGPELAKIKLGDGLSHIAVNISRSMQPSKDLVALIKLVRIFKKKNLILCIQALQKLGFLRQSLHFLFGFQFEFTHGQVNPGLL